MAKITMTGNLQSVWHCVRRDVGELYQVRMKRDLQQTTREREKTWETKAEEALTIIALTVDSIGKEISSIAYQINSSLNDIAY